MSRSSRFRESGRTKHAKPPAVYLATVDEHSRLSLRGPAAAVGWRPGHSVGLTVDCGLLRLSDIDGAFIATEGVTTALDDRRRVTIPDDVGGRTGLRPGVSAVIMTTIDRGLVMLPAARLLRRAG